MLLAFWLLEGQKANSAVQGVKVNGEMLTPNEENVVDIEITEISGATAEQGQKADSAVQGVKVNGELLTPDEKNVVDIEFSEFSGATAEQGSKADSAIQGVKLNGTLLEPDDQNIVDVIVSESASSAVTYEAEISTNWETGESGEYVQTIEVSGILASDNPVVDVVLDASKDTAPRQLEDWSCVSKIETSDGSVTVYCFEEKPTSAIEIKLLCVR